MIEREKNSKGRAGKEGLVRNNNKSSLGADRDNLSKEWSPEQSRADPGRGRGAAKGDKRTQASAEQEPRRRRTKPRGPTHTPRSTRARKRRRGGNKGSHSNLGAQSCSRCGAPGHPSRSRPDPDLAFSRGSPDPDLAFSRGGSSCPSEGSRPRQRTPASLSSFRPP